MKNRIIYKYMSLKDGLRVISQNTIKFSNPTDFNDPFDCNKELIKFEVTEDFVKEHLEKGLLTLDEEEKKLPMSQLITQLKETTYNFKNSTTNEVFDTVLKSVWISCFSKTYRDILMWSHYGDQHKGLCIGFNFYGLSKTFDFIPSVVKYRKKFEPIDYCENPEIAMKYLVSTKSKKWKYEREIRLRTKKEAAPRMDENGVVSIDKVSISKIIIGCRCALKDAEIKEKLEKYNLRNIELIRLEKSKNTFGFDEIKLAN